MRLLLTHGFFLCEDEKERSIMRPYPPLGLLYLCAYLRQRGLEVDVFDSTFSARADLLNILDTEVPGWLGVYGNLLTRTNVLAIARHARARGWRVIVGGPEPSQYPEQYLDAGAEYIVPGEGEVVLANLLAGQAAPAGVIFRDPSGNIVRTAPAPLIPDLDSLPWPARDAIDLPRYLSTWRTHHGKGSVSLITARGCPYECRWCSHATYGRTHRRRSVTSVADEVEWILETYQPEMLWYADDVFTIHTGWTLDYAREAKRRGIRIPFECITRADRLDNRTADALAELGCFRVWIGAESGSQRVLDGMKRGVRLEQVRHAIRLAQERGIDTGMFLMWGYEGEQIEDIEATVNLVKTCKPSIYLTTVSYPIKGTPYYDEVAERLVQIGEWSEATGRDVKIRGRHSRRYYQFADDLLHASMEVPDNPIRVSAARAALETSFCEVEA